MKTEEMMKLMTDSFREGKVQFREELSDYLQELANHVTEEDAENLPQFLRVLSVRLRNGELV